ncbi:MAG: hypothetical protein ACRCTR_05420 [Actinomycetota bacterium]
MSISRYRRYVHPRSPNEHAARCLRQAVLAVSVLDDIFVRPHDLGIQIILDEPGSSFSEAEMALPSRLIPWTVLTQACAGASPDSLAGRLRLRDWLRALGACLVDPDATRRRAVPLALPHDHPLHPGSSWVIESTLGGAMDVGVGIKPAPRVASTNNALRASDTATLPVPLPVTAATYAGVSTATWWPALAERREVMAGLLVERLHREGAVTNGELRPVGGIDVLTLLSSQTLRRHVATSDGIGLRAVAVPIRSRGWFDLSRIDPAFTGAATAATEPEARGFSRPLLITVDEISTAAGNVSIPEMAAISLTDPAGGQALVDRAVRYR